MIRTPLRPFIDFTYAAHRVDAAGTAPAVLEIGMVLLLAVGAGWSPAASACPRSPGYLGVGLIVRPSRRGYVADPSPAAGLADVGVVLLLFEVGIEGQSPAWAAKTKPSCGRHPPRSSSRALPRRHRVSPWVELCRLSADRTVDRPVFKRRRRQHHPQPEADYQPRDRGSASTWSVMQDMTGCVRPGAPCRHGACRPIRRRCRRLHRRVRGAGRGAAGRCPASSTGSTVSTTCSSSLQWAAVGAAAWEQLAGVAWPSPLSCGPGGRRKSLPRPRRGAGSYRSETCSPCCSSCQLNSSRPVGDAWRLAVAGLSADAVLIAKVVRFCC